MALLATGLVGLFVPFSSTIDLLYAAGGCVLFSGYVVFDTFTITKKLSPDEYIMGAISLYLDFINLCKFFLSTYLVRIAHSSSVLSILRVLNNVQDR